MTEPKVTVYENKGQARNAHVLAVATAIADQVGIVMPRNAAEAMQTHNGWHHIWSRVDKIETDLHDNYHVVDGKLRKK